MALKTHDKSALCTDTGTNKKFADANPKNVAFDSKETIPCLYCFSAPPCTPYVLGSHTTTGSLPTWDLRPFKGPGKGPIKDAYWRLIEMGSCFPGAHPWYGAGCVDGTGTLVGLPDSFTSAYFYPGYMELQIGCACDNPGPYFVTAVCWPGICQPISHRGLFPAC